MATMEEMNAKAIWAKNKFNELQKLAETFVREIIKIQDYFIILSNPKNFDAYKTAIAGLSLHMNIKFEICNQLIKFQDELYSGLADGLQDFVDNNKGQINASSK